MSMESATKFYETLEKDTDLQKQLAEIKDNRERENLVKEVLGYDFSLEEIQKVIFDRNPELTDEELEAVVGGTDVLEYFGFGDNRAMGIFTIIAAGVAA